MRIIGRRLRVSWSETACMAFSKIDSSIDGYDLPLEGPGKIRLSDLNYFDGDIVARDLGPPAGDYGLHDVDRLISDKALWTPLDRNDPVGTNYDGLVGRRLTIRWNEKTTLQIDIVAGVRFPHLKRGRTTGSTIVDLMDVMGETVEANLSRPWECAYGKTASQIVEDGRFWGPDLRLDSPSAPLAIGYRMRLIAWHGSSGGRPIVDDLEGARFSTDRGQAELQGTEVTRWSIDLENALLVRHDTVPRTTERTRPGLVALGYDGFVEVFEDGSVSVVAFDPDQFEAVGPTYDPPSPSPRSGGHLPSP